MRDFTLAKYRELCLVLIENGYTPRTVREYLEGESIHGIRTVILRHDVDRKIMNALHMAELEHAMNIKSTYYFRYPYTFKPEIIRTIHNLGHEIGYHYETMSKAKGNPEKALQLFEQELAAFREISDCMITTICMHGSPLSPHDNRDLWLTHDYLKYGIEGEAYLSMAGKGLQYLSDTGRSWSGKHSVRDKMSDTEAIYLKTTDNLLEWIGTSETQDLYLTVHPERWAVDKEEWAFGYVKDLVVNAGKTVLVMMR